MAHIIVKEDTDISEIIQDIMLYPPEKYYIEIHLDKNYNVLGLIILNVGISFENIVKTLEYFARKYNEMQEPKYKSLSLSFSQIIKEMQEIKPLYPENLFQLDKE